MLWLGFDLLLVLFLLSIFAFDKELLDLIESGLLSRHGLHHRFEIVILHAVLLLKEVAALFLELLILGHLGHEFG